MGSSTTQDVRTAPGGEKRRRKDPVNRIAAAKRRQDYEKANPEPVQVLGPVPAVKDQMAELMTNPAWVMARMREHQAEGVEVEPDDFDHLDRMLEEDDEPEIVTQYTVMEPIPFPEDIGPEAREPVPPEGEATQVAGESPPVVESPGDASTSQQ